MKTNNIHIPTEIWAEIFTFIFCEKEYAFLNSKKILPDIKNISQTNKFFNSLTKEHNFGFPNYDFVKTNYFLAKSEKENKSFVTSTLLSLEENMDSVDHNSVSNALMKKFTDLERLEHENGFLSSRLA